MLCTDGLANVGLGALDDLQNDEQRQVAESFYEELGREVCMCRQFIQKCTTNMYW